MAEKSIELQNSAHGKTCDFILAKRKLSSPRKYSKCFKC